MTKGMVTIIYKFERCGLRKVIAGNTETGITETGITEAGNMLTGNTEEDVLFEEDEYLNYSEQYC